METTKTEPTQFAIAKSSNGTIGLITSKEAVTKVYPERTVTAWTGIILEENVFQGRGNDKEKTITAQIGGEWSSSNPEVIGFVKAEDVLALIL